jgi:hypothetical protein
MKIVIYIWLKVEGCEGTCPICRVRLYLGKYGLELPAQYELSSLLVSCLYLHASIKASVALYSSQVWQIIIIGEI